MRCLYSAVKLLRLALLTTSGLGRSAIPRSPPIALRSSSLRSASLRSADTAGQDVFVFFMLNFLPALLCNSGYEKCLGYIGTEGTYQWSPIATAALRRYSNPMPITVPNYNCKTDRHQFGTLIGITSESLSTRFRNADRHPPGSAPGRSRSWDSASVPPVYFSLFSYISP